MKVLGISAFYHDSAVALLDDGVVRFAAQEERFSRLKHDPAFPREALASCLESTGLALADIDHVVFYEKPLLTFERLLETYFAFAPRGLRSFCTAMPRWLADKLYQKRNLLSGLQELDADFDPERLLFAEHHQSHAASAFYPSPFDESLILTMDGVGEWATGTLAIGRGSQIEVLEVLTFPHSLGLLYSAFTYYLGFVVNSGEYKVMGLAPYGEPRFCDEIRARLIDIKEDGSFRLDMAYFDYCTGLTMTNGRFHRLFGGPPRVRESPLEQRHLDLAASIQRVTEEVLVKLVGAAVAKHPQRNLCLAGGVALNCAANGKLLRSGVVERIWVQPAAGDAGAALGAAYAVHHQFAEQPRRLGPGFDGMAGAYLGPEYTDGEVRERLTALGAVFEVLPEPALLARTCEALAQERIVGWMQGRLEYGPRALGSRSILGDARSPRMQRAMNLGIKNRESFRPFAPAVLEEKAAAWFDLTGPSPYMSFVTQVAAAQRLPVDPEIDARTRGLDKLEILRSTIPAVTHVDGSARVQTVSAATNPRFHRLLSTFDAHTGCPVLVNTSFNVRGEPIVCTPEDAYRCFMATGMDILVIGEHYLVKDRQPVSAAAPYVPAGGLD